MNIELGQLQSGELVILSDPPFGRVVCRVEYYRDQRLMMLVYDEGEEDGELMHYELSPPAVARVETCPSILIVSQDQEKRLHGYDVPLVHIGC